MRLVSINIWDLPIPLPGLDRVRRRRRLLEQLPLLAADVVLIQEAFRPPFKRQIAEALAGFATDSYLDVARRAGFLRMDGSGGLFSLSRWRLATSLYLPFRRFNGMKPDERIGRKGCLWSEVDTPVGRVLMGNTHLYAGTGRKDARVRSMQTRALLRQLERLPPLPTVVAGDFNMALEYEDGGRPTGFELMRQAGFHEVAEGASSGLVTMTPRRNRYARYAAFGKPDRRLTQVFTRGLDVAEPPRVCLDDPPISDHFGLAVGLRVSTREAGSGKREA